MASTPDSEDSTRDDDMFTAHFYGDEHAKDDYGRTLDQICAFSDRELEGYHNYIQILFPLPERSGVVMSAPIITKEVRKAFLEEESLRKRLFDAFVRMANFYAFDVEGNESSLTLKPKANFERLASQTWLTRMDHNHLRITRIIRSLRVLGLEAVAQAFYNVLTNNAVGVSKRSLMYWTRAAERPLYLPPDEADDSTDIIEWLKDDLV